MTTLNKAHRILWLSLAVIAGIGAIIANPYQLWLVPLCWLVSALKLEDQPNAED